MSVMDIFKTGGCWGSRDVYNAYSEVTGLTITELLAWVRAFLCRTFHMQMSNSWLYHRSFKIQWTSQCILLSERYMMINAITWNNFFKNHYSWKEWNLIPPNHRCLILCKWGFSLVQAFYFYSVLLLKYT